MISALLLFLPSHSLPMKSQNPQMNFQLAAVANYCFNAVFSHILEIQDSSAISK